MLRQAPSWCCAVLSLALLALPARAGVVAVSAGSAEILTPSAGTNLSDDSGFTSSLVRAFNERAGVAANNLSVNTVVANLAAGAFTNAKAAGAAGTVSGTFDSHLLHFDFPGNATTGTIDVITSGAFRDADGFVTFDAPIVAIQYLRNRLDATDGLFGLAGITYPNSTPPAGNAARDLESGDDIWLSADRRTLYYNWRVGGAFDEVRVLTASPTVLAVPEPGGLLLAMAGVTCLLGVRGRK